MNDVAKLTSLAEQAVKMLRNCRAKLHHGNFLIVFDGALLQYFKDVRAHCYCASLVRRPFIGHERATSFSSARTESKTQQNIELMTFALGCEYFFGCSVTPTFFSADHFLF